MAQPNDFDWKTPEIREAEAQVDRSARAVRELAARIEAEGLPTIPPTDADDPDVRKAQEANLKKMRAAFQAFEEGATLQDVINADAAGGKRGDGDDGDGGNVVLRDTSW